jgi:tRNA (pseudouridine54-N1)-methyltransferase
MPQGGRISVGCRHLRSFVVIGQTALASGQFSLEDLPGSSGRLDVLLRCVRAALLVSHGLRRDARVYLVLRAGAPRVVRVSGESAKFLRPDERSLAILFKKTLAVASGPEFAEVRPGLATCSAGLEAVLADVGDAPRYLLHEQGADVRRHAFGGPSATFFIGDHLGFDAATLAQLDGAGCRRLSVGPVSLHSDDVVSVLSNELDYRYAERRGG